MSDPSALRQLLGTNLSIPTIPDVVLKINKLMQDPNCGTAEIGAVVSQDAPLAAKVLRIANSAYYGLSKECLSTEHASTVLGMRVLKNIVTQISVINQFDHLEQETGFDVSSIWRHAILTAQLASKLAPLAKNVRILSPDEFYVCGLLHDVGKVVLLDSLGARYADILTRSQQTGTPIEELEREALAFDHQDVGALVASRWGLPDALGDAIQMHHAKRADIGPRLHVVLIDAVNQLAHYTEADDRENATLALAAHTNELGIDPSLVQGMVDYAIEVNSVDM